MFPNKIKITDELLHLIIDTRKKYNLTAYQLSEQIGKKKSWLPNIENKRTKNISSSDLNSLFKIFADKENLSSEQYIIKYLPRNCMIELEDGVTAPCFHVKQMLGLEERDDINNKTALQYVDEHIYRTFERSDKLKEKDIKASLSNLVKTIHTQLQQYDIDTQDKYSQLIDTMTINLKNNFDYIMKLYGETFCPSDPFSYDSNSKKDYIIELETLKKYIATYLRTIEWKSYIYSFLEGTPFNTYRFFDNLKHWENLDQKEDEKLYFAFTDVEGYQFALFSYIEYHQELSSIFKNIPEIPYHFLFSKFSEILKLFLNVADLNYSFSFDIPDDTVTPETLEQLHRQTDKILFEIEKELCSKFKNRSKWF